MIGRESQAIADASDNCLIQVVAEAMKDQPALEAVKFNRAQKSISLATMGKVSDPDLERLLTTKIQNLQSGASGEKCALLDGAADCANCERSGGASHLAYLQVKHEPDTTTVTRITCPTAPR